MLPTLLCTHAEQVASGQLGYCCFDQAALLWHTEMACGVYWGILLVIVQAEHVCCFWAKQAQGQNGNRYVGFLQQDNGLRQLDGSFPQNQFRQASISPHSAQSSSLNPETVGSSGYNRGFSHGSYTQTVSQPGQSGYNPNRLMQSSLLSNPNWKMTNVKMVNAQKAPEKQVFGLSTSIESGSSVSKHNQNQNAHTDGSRRTWPVQQGAWHTGQYLSSSSASVPSPGEKSSFTSASHWFAAQKPPSAAVAKTPTLYGQRDFSPSMKTSNLFGAGALMPQPNSVQMQTSARGPARRVTSHRTAESSLPSGFSSIHSERARNNPGQYGARQQSQRKLFPVNGGSSQGRYKPTLNMASSHVSYTQSLPAQYKQNAPISFKPRSQEMPTSQKFTYKSSYSSNEPIFSSTSSGQSLWNSRNRAQGADNLPASGSSGAGSSSVHYAPTRTHSIPERFGGFAIRRLRGPDGERKPVQKPLQTYTVPPRQTAPYKAEGPSPHQKSEWKRVRLSQRP